MKKILLFFALMALFVSCEQKKEIAAELEKVEYASFGVSISDEGALSKEEMMANLATLKTGDTLDVKFKSAINEVCQKKGCWMSLNLTEDEELFVKFKDYDFFVPMNTQDKEVIVKGKAYVNIETVADLKHYAKDGGKSQTFIDSIVKPEVRYSFMADGVLIAKK